jgi:hypothetical protein
VWKYGNLFEKKGGPPFFGFLRRAGNCLKKSELFQVPPFFMR